MKRKLTLRNPQRLTINGRDVKSIEIGGAVVERRYEVLEFVRNNNVQFALGFRPQPDMEYEVVFATRSSNFSGWHGVFGNYQSETTNCTRLLHNNGYHNLLYNHEAKASTALVCTPNLEDGVVYAIHLSESESIVNGIKHREFSWTHAADTCTKELNLGGTGNTTSDIDIYRFRVWQAGELIHDYYPVWRLSDGALGVYDVVTRTFPPAIGDRTRLVGGESSGLWVYE